MSCLCAVTISIQLTSTIASKSSVTFNRFHVSNQVKLRPPECTVIPEEATDLFSESLLSNKVDVHSYSSLRDMALHTGKFYSVNI